MQCHQAVSLSFCICILSASVSSPWQGLEAAGTFFTKVLWPLKCVRDLTPRGSHSRASRPTVVRLFILTEWNLIKTLNLYFFSSLEALYVTKVIAHRSRAPPESTNPLFSFGRRAHYIASATGSTRTFTRSCRSRFYGHVSFYLNGLSRLCLPQAESGTLREPTPRQGKRDRR